MAYTQDQINAAYAAERANGASDADLARIGAEQFGVTGDQFNLAKMAYAPAPAPAAAAAPAPAFGRFTQEQYDGARAWSDGKSGKEILSKAAELGLTAEELGNVFGEHGGSGQQVMDASGYATASNGARISPITGKAEFNIVPWSSAKDRALDGWSYDINAPRGWVFNKRSGGGAPTTGINLSDLQGVTDWNVQPNQTVQSQLEQIIAADSPLMQQARARALQQANARGLLNSSMAVTAGHSAVLDSAMPIAQQDASTYSDAARFNADSRNTFSRDNNAFVRDAFMADFNLGANEWAAQQDFDRQYKMLDRQQQLTLERDAVQNGYQSARDRYLNEYQVGRDATQNEWNMTAADKEAALRLQLAQIDAAARAASQQADTSMERLQMQIGANKEERALNALNAARSDYSKMMVDISGSNLSTEAKDKMIGDLTVSTNAIISGTAQQLGWDANSWLIKTSGPADAPAPAPAPAPAAPAPGDSGP